MYRVYEITDEARKSRQVFKSKDEAAEFIENCARNDVDEILGMTSEDDGFYNEVDEFKDMYEIVEEV